MIGTESRRVAKILKAGAARVFSVRGNSHRKEQACGGVELGGREGSQVKEAQVKG